MHRHDWHVNKGVPGDAVPRGREGELPARQRRHLRQERRRVSESFHQWQISGRNSRTAEETTRRIFTKVHLHILISRLNQYIERALFRINGRSPGLVVMGDDSCLRGCVFESQCYILDGHFLTLICCQNCIVCLERLKINKKRLGLAH